MVVTEINRLLRNHFNHNQLNMKKFLLLSLLSCAVSFNNSLSAQIAPSQNGKMADVLGITHAGGKYHFTTDNYLKEGVDEIQNTGTHVIKLFFGRSSVTTYPAEWGNNWPAFPFNNLTQLAQTPYFLDAFGRSQFHTYVLTAFEMSNGGNITNFKDGLSATERTNLYNEIYDFTTYLFNTYNNTGKTFVLANWEGDGLLGFVNLTSLPPANVQHTILKGFTEWLNIRQDAITAARNDAMKAGKTNVSVLGAAEFNHVSIRKAYDWPTAVDSVIPYTHMDLYSFSNWKTNTTTTVDDFDQTIAYIKSKTPPSALFGSDNLYLGETGTYETKSIDGTLYKHTDKSDRLSREIMQKNTQYALKAGIRFILHWEIFDNGLKDGVTVPVGQNATEAQGVGVGIKRADGSYSGIYTYYKSIMGQYVSNYKNVYEIEAQPTTTSAGGTESDIIYNTASGSYFSKLTASALNDWIQYVINTSQTGLCDVKIRVRKGPTYGKFRLTIDGASVGSEIDCYNASTNLFEDIDLGNFAFSTKGNKNFKFTSTGKSGSNYDLGIDAIELTPVNKATQTITFNALQSKTISDTPFPLSATSSSGLVVKYQSSNPDVAKITTVGDQSIVSLIKAGTATITATQSGNDNYFSATPVKRTLLVNSSSGILPTEIIVDNADLGFSTVGSWSTSASSTDRYGADFANDGTSGSDVGKSAKWTPDISVAGTFDIYMLWNAGTTRAQYVPAEIKYFNGISSSVLDQQINGGKWNLLGSYFLNAGTDNYVKIDATSAGYTIADAVKFVLKDLASPSRLTVTSGTGNSANLQWDSVSGANGYNIYSATTEAGPYTKMNANPIATTTFNDLNWPANQYYRITAVSAYGESNLSEFATASVKLEQTINFNALLPMADTDAPLVLTASATSGLPVIYSSSDPTVAIVVGGNLQVKRPGLTTIRASQIGNENFLVAPDVSQTLVVNATNPLAIDISKLKYFKVNIGFGNDLVLNWSIDDDPDIAYFEVEKLSSNKEFIALGRIIYKSKSKEYSFTDDKTDEGTSYYRLKIVDKEGMADYSSVLIWKNQPEIKISPNPATDFLNIRGIGKNDRIQLFNSFGVANEIYIQFATNEAKADIGNLATGVYILVVENHETRQRRAFKFVKY